MPLLLRHFVQYCTCTCNSLLHLSYTLCINPHSPLKYIFHVQVFDTITLKYSTTTFSLQYWTGKKINSVGSSLVLKCTKSSNLIICILLSYSESSHVCLMIQNITLTLFNITLLLMSNLVNEFFIMSHQSQCNYYCRTSVWGIVVLKPN